ncbi:ganglioside-induced differentiation-associated protein 1-like [Glandiceps talaboti]
MAHNDLLLYDIEYSFYSQRVRMALAAKRLSYRKYHIRYGQFEHITPWYMRINPLGKVPVLVDDNTVVTDSERIIQYLDDIFPDTIRLTPDESTHKGRRCKYFKKLCSKIDSEVLTTSVPLLQQISGSEHVISAFAPNVMKESRKVFRDVIPAKCEEYAKAHPDLKEAYQKKSEWGSKYTLDPDVDELQMMLHLTDDVMSKLEIEIERNYENCMEGEIQWLCGENFTSADIYWSVTLYRLEQLGLEKRYWADGKRPRVEEYYKQVKNDKNFIKSKPSLFVVLIDMVKPKLPWILAIVATAVVGFGVGYALTKGKGGNVITHLQPFPLSVNDVIWVWKD